MTTDNNEHAGLSAGSVSIGEAQCTGYDEWYCHWYVCPKCQKDYIASSFSYCPNCGVKLAWQPHAIPEP